MKSILTLALLSLLLVGCSLPSGRYSQKHDSIPSRLPTSTEMADPVPADEPKSKRGNKDYQVWGQSYQVLADASGFTEQGMASWYGEKFHGHETSSGEIYDMYAMTAAHKSLPLPSFVRVTNLDNNKQIIVRVNDRGPFHQGRVIDLSFSAAYKLGMLATGTAPVRIEAITDYSQGLVQVEQAKPPATFSDSRPAISRPLPKKQAFIQVFATRNQALAADTAKGLTQLFQLPVQLPLADGIFRVQVGPIDDIDSVDSLLQTLKSSGYPQAFTVN